jgi:hypothetical protein
MSSIDRAIHGALKAVVAEANRQGPGHVDDLVKALRVLQRDPTLERWTRIQRLHATAIAMLVGFRPAIREAMDQIRQAMAS